MAKADRVQKLDDRRQIVALRVGFILHAEVEPYSQSLKEMAASMEIQAGRRFACSPTTDPNGNETALRAPRPIAQKKNGSLKCSIAF